MYGDIRPTGLWVADIPDPGVDFAFAQQAVTYLKGRGFDEQAVVQCLRDEFGVDLATAETIAHSAA